MSISTLWVRGHGAEDKSPTPDWLHLEDVVATVTFVWWCILVVNIYLFDNAKYFCCGKQDIRFSDDIKELKLYSGTVEKGLMWSAWFRWASAS